MGILTEQVLFQKNIERREESPLRFPTHAPLSEMKAASEELLSTSALVKRNPFCQKNPKDKSLVEKTALLREAIHRNKCWDHMIPELTAYLFTPKLQGSEKTDVFSGSSLADVIAGLRARL